MSYDYVSLLCVNSCGQGLSFGFDALTVYHKESQ